MFAHQMNKHYRETYDLFASCGILFNHESPLGGLEFVTRRIIYELA
jgi:GDPmannose 4,6-dehydratase